MSSINIPALISQHGLLSDQVEASELQIILQCLARVLESSDEGSIVEMGCYSGTTSVYISRILKELSKPHSFHVYDSFAGLPEKASQDQSALGIDFTKGELSVSKNTLVSNFKKVRLPLPTIHKGWFSELSTQDIPKNICFAFLDGDYYQSIKDSLRLVQGKLAPKAVIIIDDYANPALPGAKQATDEWLQDKPYKLQIQSSLAIIYT